MTWDYCHNVLPAFLPTFIRLFLKRFTISEISEHDFTLAMAPG